MSELGTLWLEQTVYGQPAVIGLRFGRSPHAIARFVVAVIVDALKGHSGWRFSHVGKEILEDEPPLADGNASAAVIGELFVFGVEAPILHNSPAVINRRSCTSAVMSVYQTKIAGGFPSVASAAGGMPSSEIVAARNGFSPAITKTDPFRRSYCHAVKTNDGQATEALTSDIFESGHSSSISYGVLQ